MTDKDQSPKTLQQICQQLRTEAENERGDQLQVQTIFNAFSGRIFGPLLLVPAIVVMIPLLGGIPTVPTMMGLLVLLIAGQKLFGRKHPWLPQFVLQREVSQEKFDRGLDTFEPWAKRIDWFTRPRLQFLVQGPMKYVIALLCVILACTLPPLELLPFAAFVPGLGIFCLGLAITAEDGLLGLLGMLAAIGAMGAVVWLLL